MVRYGVLNQAERVAEKERRRQEDAEALRSGRISPAEMKANNGFFSALDMREFRVAAIGAREIARFRSRQG